MKQLFWKECYELRFLPLGAALAVAVLMAGIKGYTQTYPPTETLLSVLISVWLLFAALTGSGVISQEIGTGTLLFLSSLPVSRRTLWWVKVVASLGMQLLSLITSTFTWILLCAFFGANSTSLNIAWSQLTIILSCLLLSVFFVALAISSFFDRSLSALCAAMLVVVGLGALFINIANRISPHSPDAMVLELVVFTIPTFAMISYWTFTRGETLRGRKRFIVAGITGGVCVGISLVILATASAFGAWG